MKILVSACLMGHNCRYDGNNSRREKVIEFVKGHEVFLVCPESMGGLPIPRVPSEIISEGKVISKDGNDVTSYFEKGSDKALKIALDNQVDLAILKARSPSCGNKEIYDGTFSGKLVKGQGMLAKKLTEHNIKVISEDDL